MMTGNLLCENYHLKIVLHYTEVCQMISSYICILHSISHAPYLQRSEPRIESCPVDSVIADDISYMFTLPSARLICAAVEINQGW